MPRLSFNPEKEILDYCGYIMNSHTQVRCLNKNKRTWHWDFPAVAVVCHNRECNKKRVSYSHYPSHDNWHPVLRVKLETIGQIGKCLIGNCAEQHAANNFMNSYLEGELSNLFFSSARRPRTKERIPYCVNCKAVFPNI